MDTKAACSFCHAESSASELGKICDDPRFLLRCAKCRKDCFGGVCYVVSSECTQGNKPENPSVGKLTSLPHVIYQPQNVKHKLSSELIEWYFGNFLAPQSHAIIATLIPQVKLENDILRTYLLQPSSRLKLLETNKDNIPHRNGSGDQIIKLEDYSQLSQLFYDQTSIVLHYTYNASSPFGLETFRELNSSVLETSDIQLVLQLRKGTFKTFGNTINCRMDVFVGHNTWQTLDASARDNLKSILALFEEKIQTIFNEHNKSQKTASPSKQSKLTNLPMVLVKMRDTFKIQLLPVQSTTVLSCAERRKIKKTTWYIPHDNIPSDYDNSIHAGVAPKSDVGVPVGITSIENFFSEEELVQLESEANTIDLLARDGYYARAGVPYTVQSSYKGERLVRSKFFYGARYLWTKEQMQDSNSSYASGIRVDVAGPPNWFKILLLNRLTECGIIPMGFVNEYAMNIYHDGSEGLAQHFDDKSRFQRPIYSLRLFSNCRLSFGSKDFSMSNSLFFVPLARGCITILERGGYAADNVKHCIRPQDMGGKSGSILLRQIHPNLIKEARALHRYQWFATWLCSVPGLEDPLSYVGRFVEEELDPSSLLLLTECDLQKLGFVKMGPRKLVLHQIQTMNPKYSGVVDLSQIQKCEDPRCTCRASVTTGREDRIEIEKLESGMVGTVQPVPITPTRNQMGSNQNLDISHTSPSSRSPEGKTLTPRKRPFLIPDSVPSQSSNPNADPSPPKKKQPTAGVAALLNPL